MKGKIYLPQQIDELEEFFSSKPIPQGPVKLNEYLTIHDTNKFVKANLTNLRKEFPYNHCYKMLIDLKRKCA